MHAAVSIWALLGPKVHAAVLAGAAAPSLLGVELDGVDTWKIAFILLAGLLAMVVSLVGYRFLNRTSRDHSQFLSAAAPYGLTREEQDLLRCLAGLAGLKCPHAIFSREGSFRAGGHALLQSSRVRNMTAEGQRYIAGVLDSLQDKLGFRPKDSDVRIVTTRQIPQGARIRLSNARRMESVEAVVQRCDTLHLELQTAEPLDVQGGASWVGRYGDGGSVWAFDVPSVRPEGTRLLMEHSGDVRFVKRRRFPRMPVDLPAYLAAFPFGATTGAPPNFVQAHLVELAGAGLRLESPVELAMGERALVVLILPSDKTIQATGKVRRVSGFVDRWDVVIELVYLTGGEIDELARETALLAASQPQPLPEPAPEGEGTVQTEDDAQAIAAAKAAGTWQDARQPVESI
jgi:hypothetical protein